MLDLSSESSINSIRVNYYEDVPRDSERTIFSEYRAFSCFAILDCLSGIITIIIIKCNLDDRCQKSNYAGINMKLDSALLISSFVSIILSCSFFLLYKLVSKRVMPMSAIKVTRAMYGLISVAWMTILALVLFGSSMNCLTDNKVLWSFGLINVIVKLLATIAAVLA